MRGWWRGEGWGKHPIRRPAGPGIGGLAIEVEEVRGVQAEYNRYCPIERADLVRCFPAQDAAELARAERP